MAPQQPQWKGHLTPKGVEIHRLSIKMADAWLFSHTLSKHFYNLFWHYFILCVCVCVCTWVDVCVCTWVDNICLWCPRRPEACVGPLGSWGTGDCRQHDVGAGNQIQQETQKLLTIKPSNWYLNAPHRPLHSFKSPASDSPTHNTTHQFTQPPLYKNSAPEMKWGFSDECVLNKPWDFPPVSLTPFTFSCSWNKTYHQDDFGPFLFSIYYFICLFVFSCSLGSPGTR